MSATKRWWLWAVLLPAFSFVAETCGLLPAPRPWGFVARLLHESSIFIGLLLLAAVPASLYFAIRGLIRWRQPGELTAGFSRSLACLTFVGLSVPAIWSAQSVRRQAFVRASHAGDRIIEALAEYHQEHDEYPDRLEQLVPDHLEHIPGTGLAEYPEFTYRKDVHDNRPRPGEYELRIDCPSGGINFDRFIYWPTEQYPDRLQGNHVEPIRTWAYIHE